MLVRLFAAVATFLTVAANNGPSSLYSLLNGQTFNPPGYTIVMYQSCMQNQNAGNPCGSFSGYQSSNGQYTYQLYGPEAAVSPTCSRTFKLTLACGPTMQMSGVNENPTCVYSATLSLPQVCGVDLTVGNEIASVSPTVPPPSASSTNTLTATSTTTLTATPTTSSTNTATSTPLYMITAFPSTTSTMTLTATTTPLYMITAYPSSSPQNVSATSTPLFYYTAYPSIQPNGTGEGLLGMASNLINSGSSTSIIIGSVALGIVGIAAIGGAIAYFRGGGTVGGFISKVKEQKGAITQFANALPISAEQKAKLNKVIEEPTSLVPQQVLEKVEGLKEQALQVNNSVIQMLPSSVAAVVTEKQAALVHHVQEKVLEKVQEKKEALLSFAPVPLEPTPASINETADLPPAPANSPVADVVHVAISAEQVELVKEFLAQKASTN